MQRWELSMFVFRFVSDILRYGFVAAWKKQDGVTKWLIIMLFIIIMYKPIVRLLEGYFY